MKMIKNFGLFAMVLIISYLSSIFFGQLYSYFFNSVGGLFFVSQRVGNYLIGLPLSYIFFLVFLFTALGGKKKYWWIGILSIPAIAFELYFDFEHIYFPIALGIIAWGISLGAHAFMSYLAKK